MNSTCVDKPEPALPTPHKYDQRHRNTKMHPFETPDSSPTRLSSPRPSIDLTNPPHSPFLHNLTQRLRKGSNASSHSGGVEGPLSAAQPAAAASPSPADPIKKTEKTKEVKKLLAAMVRDDWEYPSTTVKVKEKTNNDGIPYREPLGYRVREEWSSDIEAEERKAAYAYASAHSGPNANAHGRGKSQNNGPYKFESPDAVGDMVLERKRKRRRLVEEELSVNEGLRVWTNRRDAWTGAVKQRPKDAAAAKRREGGFDNRRRPSHTIFRRSSSMLSHCHGHGHGHGRNGSVSTSSGSPLNPGSGTTRSSAANGDGGDALNTNANTNTGTAAIEVSSSIESDIVPDNDTTGETLGSLDSVDGPWLPVFPPLLPSSSDGNHQDVHHLLRDRITPRAYSTIYSKVVVQGLAPNVPIPLVHMIPALVEGWKSEGNWPPQPAAVSVADVKKGRRSSAFAKWRREHQHHHHHHQHTIDTRAADGQVAQHEREDGKSRVRRSISMMKRVLGGSDNTRGGGDAAAAGLEELGIEFRDDDHDGERDNEEEIRKNAALNKALLG